MTQRSSPLRSGFATAFGSPRGAPVLSRRDWTDSIVTSSLRAKRHRRTSAGVSYVLRCVAGGRCAVGTIGGVAAACSA